MDFIFKPLQLTLQLLGVPVDWSSDATTQSPKRPSSPRLTILDLILCLTNMILHAVPMVFQVMFMYLLLTINLSTGGLDLHEYRPEHSRTHPTVPISTAAVLSTGQFDTPGRNFCWCAAESCPWQRRCVNAAASTAPTADVHDFKLLNVVRRSRDCDSGTAGQSFLVSV